MKAEEPWNPPNLRIIDHRKLMESCAKVNEVLHYFQVVNLRKFNEILRATANEVSKLVGYRR